MAKRKNPSSRRSARFADLPAGDQQRIAKTIIGSLRRVGYFARGGYKSVHGPDQLNRRWTSAENGGEETQLPAAERNRLIALARNAARNSEHLEGVLHQLEINVIGPEGGKAVFNFPKGFEREEAQIREAFAEWASEAEYFDDASLQDCLKMILRGQLIGGDLVIVFDWGLTKESTGQIIQFEADCIGNLANFEQRFPAYTQHQGIIKNANGKTIGAIVSWSQRGETEYQELDDKGRVAAWPLIRPEGCKWKDSPFIIFRGLSRPNQIRGNSRLWSGLSTVVDVSDLQGYELQAAKDGAQKIGTVTQQEEKTEGMLAGELDPDANAAIATGNVEDYAAAVEAARAAAEESQEELDLDHIRSAGAIWDVLPPGCRYELLDTKHPNTQLVEFSKWLHGGVAFAVGLGNVHASGKADSSYSAAMAEMLLSSVEFLDEFHKLEKGFLDWVLSNWSRMYQSLGLIPGDDKLPPAWRRTCVNWIRPTRRAINPVDEQSALNSGLKNGTILYRDQLGPDWKAKLESFAEELRFCKDHDIPHLALQTVSGGIIETN
jgi:capsid protein